MIMMKNIMDAAAAGLSRSIIIIRVGLARRRLGAAARAPPGSSAGSDSSPTPSRTGDWPSPLNCMGSGPQAAPANRSPPGSPVDTENRPCGALL